MDDLYEFITKMSTDVLLQNEFSRDPERTMEAHGLDAATRRALAASSGDGGLFGVPEASWRSCTLIGDPGNDDSPDPDPPPPVV